MTNYPPPQGNYPQPPNYPPQGGPPGYPPQGGYPPGGGYAYPAPAGNGVATAALVLALIGLIVPLLGLVGLILGIVGLVKAQTPGVGGKGKAIAGIIIGGLSILILPAILLPSLNRARENANRIKCASNIRQICLATIIYQSNNRGRMPPDLASLAKGSDISAEAFICPRSDHAPASGANWEARLRSDSANCTYVYLYTAKYDPKDGRSGMGPPSDLVIVYEPLEVHDGDGANFGYADGHVEWHDEKTAKKIIAAINAGQNPPPRF